MSLSQLNLLKSVCPPSTRAIGLVTLSLALLSGCATQYPQGKAPAEGYVLNQDSATPITNTNLSGFLEQATAGSVINLAESPWGPNVDIAADQPYMAASGRECRRLNVMDSQQPKREALVCRAETGWVNQRVITEPTSGAQ